LNLGISWFPPEKTSSFPLNSIIIISKSCCMESLPSLSQSGPLPYL
jgi:hypothetical protein